MVEYVFLWHPQPNSLRQLIFHTEDEVITKFSEQAFEAAIHRLTAPSVIIIIS